MVNGRVAPDEDVENAVNNGVDIFRMCWKGLALPINFKIRGRVMKKWMASARITVPMYKPMREANPPRSPCSDTTLATIPKIPSGVNRITNMVIFIITSKMALNAFFSTSLFSSPERVTKNPNNTAKKIMASMSLLLNAWKIFWGTISISVSPSDRWFSTNPSTLPLKLRSAPSPGRIRLTRNCPVMIAKRLVDT